MIHIHEYRLKACVFSPFLAMVDVVNAESLTLLVKCLFVAALLGAFGGTVKKIEPEVVVPVTRVIEGTDGNLYEVGYDFTATQAEGAEWTAPRVHVQGQPRLSVWGYNVQGQKGDLSVPEQLKFLG